jgi:hypothetical protein
VRLRLITLLAAFGLLAIVPAAAAADLVTLQYKLGNAVYQERVAAAAINLAARTSRPASERAIDRRNAVRHLESAQALLNEAVALVDPASLPVELSASIAEATRLNESAKRLIAKRSTPRRATAAVLKVQAAIEQTMKAIEIVRVAREQS